MDERRVSLIRTGGQVDQAMFRDRAGYYDRIYHWKDYPAEAARIRALLSAAGIEDGSRVVEAACGTGSYLAALSAHYQVEGFDLHEGVLAVARTKLPGVRLFQADMADFQLDRTADALLCLFSSLGYLDPSALDAAIECFARAVRPGGVVMVEPWITPEEARPGRPVVHVWDGQRADPPEPMKLVRALSAQVEGQKAILDFHWLVVTPEGTEHFVDRHELWMTPRDTLLAAFASAGLEARWLHPGPLTGRALVLARRHR